VGDLLHCRLTKISQMHFSGVDDAGEALTDLHSGRLVYIKDESSPVVVAPVGVEAPPASL
jgi:hypothetical protein